MIPALGRQRQADLCELRPTWSTRASSRIGSKATEKPKQDEQKDHLPCIIMVEVQNARDDLRNNEADATEATLPIAAADHYREE